MKVALTTCIFAGIALSVSGAPAEKKVPPVTRQQIEEYLRAKRSQYAPQFASPCAAASSVPHPAFAPPYHWDVPGYMPGSYPGYVVPHYGYAAHHYRSVDEQLADPEMLSFSDMDHFIPEHMAMARLGGYGAPPPSMHTNSQGVLPVTTATAYGVFQNANSGGCGIPLLFSCTPSIVPGHMIDTGTPGVGTHAGGDSYRGVDDAHHHSALESHEELSHEHLSPAHEPSKTNAQVQ